MNDNHSKHLSNLIASCVLATFATEIAAESYYDNVEHVETPIFSAMHLSAGKIGAFRSFMTGFTETGPVTEFADYKFWGLEIVDQTALDLFLADRAMRCSLIIMVDAVGYIDCRVAPKTGPEYLRYMASEDWLSLFLWLPELGLAQAHCDPILLKKYVSFLDSGLHYFCASEAVPYREMASD